MLNVQDVRKDIEERKAFLMYLLILPFVLNVRKVLINGGRLKIKSF